MAGLGGGLRLLDPTWVEGLRVAAFDLYQRLWPREAAPDSPLVVVDIDEASIDRFGQWPWPRSLMARLLDVCAEAGAVALAFDMVFAEPDRTSPSELAKLPTLSEPLRQALTLLPDHEHQLATAMQRIPTALAWRAIGESRGASTSTSIMAVLGERARLDLIQFPGAQGNLEIFERAASGRGLISLAPEPDGIVRRLPAFSRIEESYWPALSLELIRLGMGAGGFVLAVGAAGLEAAVLQHPAGHLTLPVTGDGRAWIYFSDPARRPAHLISAAELLEQPPVATTDHLQGRLVLVGSTFPGLGDRHPTPMSAARPGLLIQADFIDAVLADEWLVRPSWALAGELLTLLLVLGMVTLALIHLPAWGAAAAVLGLWAMLWAGSLFLFVHFHWLLDVGFSTLVSGLMASILLTQSYARSVGERRWIRQAFAQYLPASVVDELAQHPERLRLRGENRELTLMFCDLRGFTRLSESFPPERLGELMTHFLTGLSEEVLRHGGTIDKYIGDCLMAFWNAPLETPDHTRRACLAALAMRRRLVSLNAELQAAGLLPPSQFLAIGIGLHTGPAAVGNFGSRQRFTYTALGDTVNLTAHLESLCKEFAVDIVFSEAARVAGAADWASRPLGEVRVKGRLRPVLVHTFLEETPISATVLAAGGDP